jgi:hypothetical protein
MHIKVERPRDRVDTNVRVLLDGHDISNAVMAVTVPMEIGEASTVNLTLIGDVEVVTTESTAVESRRFREAI